MVRNLKWPKCSELCALSEMSHRSLSGLGQLFQTLKNTSVTYILKQERWHKSFATMFRSVGRSGLFPTLKIIPVPVALWQEVSTLLAAYIDAWINLTSKTTYYPTHPDINFISGAKMGPCQVARSPGTAGNLCRSTKEMSWYSTGYTPSTELLPSVISEFWVCDLFQMLCICNSSSRDGTAFLHATTRTTTADTSGLVEKNRPAKTLVSYSQLSFEEVVGYSHPDSRFMFLVDLLKIFAGNLLDCCKNNFHYQV